MTRLRAKTDRGTTTMTRPITPRVTAMAKTAPISGMEAARSPRKMKKSRRIRKGRARSSACPRSLEETEAIWTSATVGPPSQVLPFSDGWAAMALWSAVTAFCSFTVPTVATTTVSVPSLRSWTGHQCWRNRGRS